MAKQFRFINRENSPRWYGLSWNEEEKAIVVSVPEQVLNAFQDVPQDAPIVRYLMSHVGFKSFEGSLKADFGFDKSLARTEHEGQALFSAKLPAIYQILEEACKDCKGKGKDRQRHDGKCLRCRGIGKESVHEWDEAHAISASVNLLLHILEFPETESSSEEHQLMTVALRTSVGMNGGSLSGRFSIPVARWLAEREGCSIESMVRAMRVAFIHMFGSEPYLRHQFRASVDSGGGWLNVSCPGDACGINPSYGSVSVGREILGYEFSCHNVDTAGQQLTLLAGLAALHDEVDRELRA